MTAGLDGRVIVVTGAASGIGQATCHELQQRGADVVGVDRELTGAPDWSVRADLSAPGDIDHALERLPSQVDGLCAVAGLPGTAGLERVRAVNYLGLRHLAAGLLGRMTAGASIAAAASIAGSQWRERAAAHLELAAAESFDDGLAWCREHPIDDALSYPYFKEALIVWGQRLAAQLSPRQIRVNTVSPGPVETPILRDFRTSLGDERVRHDIERVGRAGTPADIAPVFAFLMSPESAWMSGADLACDGGLAAMNVA